MATNNFKPFSTGSNANVIAQADYEALDALINGFQSGKASAAQINKALRQSTFVAAALAQFLVNKNGTDVLDNGDLNGFVTLLGNAFAKTYLSRSNPFADIKADGTAAVTSALANLGLDIALAGKAALTGSTTQKFWVLSAPGDNNAAVPVSLLNSGLALKADLGGNANQGFAVAGGTNANSAVAYGQFVTGSNGNGVYHSYPGALQVCRGNITIQANSSATWTYPLSFASAPQVFYTALIPAGSGTPSAMWINSIASGSVSIYNPNSQATQINLLGIL